MKKVIGLSGLSGLGIGLIASIFSISLFANSPIKQVKEGKMELVCLFKDGERKVPKEMVKFEQDGYWGFTNGGASNCTLKEVK